MIYRQDTGLLKDMLGARICRYDKFSNTEDLLYKDKFPRIPILSAEPPQLWV